VILDLLLSLILHRGIFGELTGYGFLFLNVLSLDRLNTSFNRLVSLKKITSTPAVNIHGN
jgi:hypothetical protein